MRNSFVTTVRIHGRNADRIAVLVNPGFPPAAAMLKDAEEAAAAIRRRLVALRASTESELEPAFATLVREQAGALMIAADPFFNSRRDLLVALAARYRVPTIYEFRGWQPAA